MSLGTGESGPYLVLIQSTYRPLENPPLALQAIASLTGAVTKSSKGYSTLLPSRLLHNRGCITLLSAWVANRIPPWALTGVAAGERDWQASTERLVLPIWFVKPSFPEVTLGEHLHGIGTNTFMFISHLDSSIHITLPQTVLSLIHGYSPYFGIQWHVWPFYFPSKMNNQLHYLKLYPLGGFSSPLAFKDVPQGSVMLQVSTFEWHLHPMENYL